MTNDCAILKVLAELGLRNEPELTDEQEKQFQNALTDEQRYYDDIIKLFAPETQNTDK